jgi:alkaline phosphatase D
MVAASLLADEFRLVAPAGVTRPWVGADLWANPMEDWRVAGGRVENTMSGGDRNVVLLTGEFSGESAPFTVRVALDQLAERLSIKGHVGLQVGRRGVFRDYRDDAVYGRGLIAG